MEYHREPSLVYSNIPEKSEQSKETRTITLKGRVIFLDLSKILKKQIRLQGQDRFQKYLHEKSGHFHKYFLVV